MRRLRFPRLTRAILVAMLLFVWLQVIVAACGAGGVECGPTGTSSCLPQTIVTTTSHRVVHRP